jgi:hypothetical protein
MSGYLLFTLAILARADRPAQAIQTIASEPITGDVRSVKDGAIALADGKTIASGQWYSLRARGMALPDWPRTPHVEFVSGDRLTGRVVSSDGDRLHIESSAFGLAQKLSFPLSAVRVIWLGRKPVHEPRWLAESRPRDLFQSHNGDQAFGSLTAIDAEQGTLRYQSAGKDQAIELARLAAIATNTDLARVRRPKGPYYHVTLADGSRLGAADVSFDGEQWKLTTLVRESVTVAAKNLVSIDIEQGPAVSLASLKPAKYVYNSFDGEQYAPTPDRCVTGEPLRLKTATGELTFDRGLGLHADCSVTYALDGKYRRFEALVGLDARSGLKGEVALQVFLDGKEQKLDQEGTLSAAGAPIDIHIDVTGANEIVINVRRAKGGHVSDHLDLAEARIIPAK